MQNRNELFLALSACLTGFEPLELTALGMADRYLQALDDRVPAAIVNNLLAVFQSMAPQDGNALARLNENIMDDATFGPVARNVILLWYQGSWRQLPDDWRAAHGVCALDATQVLSEDAYLAGLQWTVAGGHPAGGQPQGFGSWSNPV
jgi:hypothetical protein